MIRWPTAHRASELMALTPSSQPYSVGWGPGTLTHCEPSQWSMSGWMLGLEPTEPTAHTSSAETAASPFRLLSPPGALGLSTTCQMGMHDGAGVGVDVEVEIEVEVAPAGKVGALAAG